MMETNTIETGKMHNATKVSSQLMENIITRMPTSVVTDVML